MTVSDDLAGQVAAAVDGVRERACQAADGSLNGHLRWIGALSLSQKDVPRLLEAAEAALGLHQPQPLYGRAIPSLCGHDSDSDPDAHFEADDGYWYCRDKITGRVCGTCAGDDPDFLHAEWPCPTYLAIAEALTGKE